MTARDLLDRLKEDEKSWKANEWVFHQRGTEEYNSLITQYGGYIDSRAGEAYFEFGVSVVPYTDIKLFRYVGNTSVTFVIPMESGDLVLSYIDIRDPKWVEYSDLAATEFMLRA